MTLRPNPRCTANHEYIEAELVAGTTKVDIAKAVGVSETTIRRYISQYLSEVVPNAVFEDDVETYRISREDKLAAEVKELRARARKVTHVDVQAERVYDEIRSALEAPAPVFDPPEPDPPSEMNRHVQAALLSDLHAGEIVDLAAMDSVNEYNWQIMEERLASWRESLLSYQRYRPYPIDELQLWFLGDMCSGSNHPEITETNEFSAAEQGVRVGHLLGDIVQSLVPHYPSIKVYGVPGNHPRLPAKPASKQVFNNFDWVAYQIADVKLENYDSVETFFPLGGYAVAEIAGLNYLLWHGDGVRSSMPGVPWGGVMRRVPQLKQTWMDKGIVLDGHGVGHFHRSAWVENILMNGSVKGPDEYSVKNFGSGESPTQLLATFDADKQRLTDVSRINL
jgi:hypothetical protein